MFTKDKITVVVVETGSALKPDEVDEAIGGMSNLCWRALTQLLNSYRDESASGAAVYSLQNNAMGAASDCGAYQAISELIVDLASRRKPTE